MGNKAIRIRRPIYVAIENVTANGTCFCMNSDNHLVSLSFTHIYPPFSLPPDLIAITCELKYCELCGCPFMRKFAPTELEERQEASGDGDWKALRKSGLITVIRRRDHGEKVCRKCRYNPVPDIAAQEEYKAQLPGTPNQMRHSAHLPKYDTSLIPPESDWQKTRRLAKEWRTAVLAAFQAKGELTAEQMQNCIPGCLTPRIAIIRVRAAEKFGTFPAIKTVRFLPSVTGKGRGPGIYRLENKSLCG